jgi:hypothetical protein
MTQNPAATQKLKPYKKMGKFFCAFGNCGYTKYDDYDINHTSTTATSRSATSTLT